MKVEPSGVIFIGECHIQTEKCTAKTPQPVTAVWTPSQTNVCKACLDEMLRKGEWQIEGARIPEMAKPAL